MNLKNIKLKICCLKMNCDISDEKLKLKKSSLKIKIIWL